MDPRLNHLNLKTSLSALLDLVLPRVCVVCGRPLIPQERHLCLECLSDLPETRYAPLGHNPMADRFNARIQVDEYEPYAYAAALYHYRAEAGYKKISQALKYHRDFGTGRWAAHLLGERLAASPRRRVWLRVRRQRRSSRSAHGAPSARATSRAMTAAWL